MDFITNLHLAKLRQEELREEARATRESHALFLERSLEFKQRSRVKTVASLVIILLAVVALFATTKAQEVLRAIFVSASLNL
jgi:hypothetical protein